MTDMTHAQIMKDFPALKARTLRFSNGAPRSMTVIGDGSKVLFLRSDGPNDLVTSLWMQVINADGRSREILIADPRDLLADADHEDVPAEERARRERARESGQGIVSYQVDAMGRHVVFSIGGVLFLACLEETDARPIVRELATRSLGVEHPEWLPVLNPRLSPDGRHVVYTTGRSLVMIDIDGHVDRDDGCDAVATYSDEVHELWSSGQSLTLHVGLAEFVAGEEMDRYEGFWWSPDSNALLFETFDSAREPLWYISDPANPEQPAVARRYPRALTRNAEVRLFHADLRFDSRGRYEGDVVREVSWDHDAYGYLASVSWTRGQDPIMLVQNRRQDHDRVLRMMVASHKAGLAHDDADDEANITDGEIPTTTLEEHHNEQWLDIVLGVPRLTEDGRLICAFNDMESDTNRLTVDGRPFTPVGWQVRRVLDISDENVLVVVQRTPELAASVPEQWRDSAERHDARSHDVVVIDYEGHITPINRQPGVWSAGRSGTGMAVAGRTMEDVRALMIHWWTRTPVSTGRHDAVSLPEHAVSESAASSESAVPDIMENGGGNTDVVARVVIPRRSYVSMVSNTSAEPGFRPNTRFVRLGEHRLFTAITRPSEQSPYASAQKLPVLLKPYGGPGFQQVVFSQAFYWESQWWADQGFLVVTSDGRGTTGRGPSWDRTIYQKMKRVTLDDQVETVHALASVAPEADLDKVAMIGWSYGGFLSALAVLDAPDVVQAACAGAPPTDWTLYDTHYTERYLGLDPDVYARNGIVGDAPKLRRPLMLIHGFSDDNVTIAHSLRLSQALMAAGREHTYLPLSGITHMTNDETVAENLLILQRDFLYKALDIRPVEVA